MKRRSKSQCPICYALDVFGDKWTLLIVRDMLIAGKRQFRDFLASSEGVATNILADRLKMLQEHGFVTREDDRENRTQAIYLPTEKTRALMPVLVAMTDWGVAYGEGDVRAPANWPPPPFVAAKSSKAAAKTR